MKNYLPEYKEALQLALKYNTRVQDLEHQIKLRDKEIKKLKKLTLNLEKQLEESQKVKLSQASEFITQYV